MNNHLRTAKQQYFAQFYERHGRRMIARISMRFGKTLMALLTVKADSKVLITYPRVKQKDSWVKDREKFHIVNGEVVYSTFTSLKKIQGKFNQIIVDEVHKASPAQRKELARLSRGTDLFCLTGSLKLKNQKALEKELGVRVLIEYDLEDAIKDGLVKDYRVFVHGLEMNEADRVVTIKSYGQETLVSEAHAYKHFTDTMEYFSKEMEKCDAEIEKPENQARIEELTDNRALFERRYTYWMNQRTNMIYNSETLTQAALKLKERYQDKKVLIFTLRTNVADELSDKSYHSKNKDEEALEEFLLSDSGHLSTVSMIAEGVTIENLWVILCHTITSNPEDFIQKLGRGLQLSDVGDRPCEVHMLYLKKTTQSNWVEQACKLLNLDKVFVRRENPGPLDSRWMTKKEEMKELHKDKQLFLYHGSFCYLNGTNELGYQLFTFVGDESEKQYSIPISKLKKV